MKSVLFTYKLGDGVEKEDARISLLESMGYKVYYQNESTIEYKPYMKDVEILVCYKPFGRLNLDDLPSLKWIQLTSMGFEQVPKEKVEGREIVITNNRGGYSIPMGEWVVLNILELIKNRKAAYRNQTNKKWKIDFSVKEIYKKKVTFIGTGDIAEESVKRLQGFDVELLGVNTNGRKVDGFDKCFAIGDIETILRQSDFVVICLPHTEKTKHLFDKKMLETMKPDAYLINVSRGAIIKEEDLITHLEEGHLTGAALDVFETEPLSEGSKLWDFERVVITAHNSWISEEIEQRRWEMILQNFQRYKKDKALLNRIQLSKGY